VHVQAVTCYTKARHAGLLDSSAYICIIDHEYATNTDAVTMHIATWHVYDKPLTLLLHIVTLALYYYYYYYNAIVYYVILLYHSCTCSMTVTGYDNIM
jgi:hypothetical protein